jgi:hypothetical protein
MNPKVQRFERWVLKNPQAWFYVLFERGNFITLVNYADPTRSMWIGLN